MTKIIISPCKTCADIKQGCCVNEDIVLTLGDVNRINKTIKDECWMEWRTLRRPIGVENLWNEFVNGAHGGARVIKNKPDGRCWFISNNGCMLANKIRPLVCRLYPYDNFTENNLGPEPKQEEVNCPKEYFKYGNIAEYIGINRHMAEHWHKQLYKEIREEIKII